MIPTFVPVDLPMSSIPPPGHSHPRGTPPLGSGSPRPAVAVHLQDVDVVGEPVQQRDGEALRTEYFGPFVEGEVGGDQDGAPLVALAEDFEEQFRPGGGQGDETQLIDGQRVEQPSFVPGPQRSALPRFHRRDAPARLPRRCTSPTWRCWTAGPAAWSRSPAALAGNRAVSSHRL